MSRFDAELYVAAVILAMVFVQAFLPETPLGFGLFFLIFAAFAVFSLVKQIPLPAEIAAGIVAVICVGALWEAQRRPRNRPS